MQRANASIIELANDSIFQSESPSSGRGQRETVLLKIEKIGPNFFSDRSPSPAHLSRWTCKGVEMRLKLKTINQTQRLLSTDRHQDSPGTEAEQVGSKEKGRPDDDQ